VKYPEGPAIWFRFKGNVQRAETLVPLAKQFLSRAMEVGGGLGVYSQLMRTDEGDVIIAQKAGENLIITIDSPFFPEVEEEVEIPPYPEPPKAQQQYVLLVELGSAGWTPNGGFAVFRPEDGGRLVFHGVAGMSEENLDPPDGGGNPCWRGGWCFDSGLGVEQVKRVDQAWHAYWDGIHWAGVEEVSELFTTSSFMNYANIDVAAEYAWKSITPGPPPPEVCGYTWDRETHGELGLFYTVVQTITNKIIYHWPEHFNQLIIRDQTYNWDGGVFKYNDSGIWPPAEDMWDDAWYNGLDVSCADIIFPNTFSRIYQVHNDDTRQWGNIFGWGQNSFPFSDKGGHTLHPHKTTELDLTFTGEVRSDFARIYPTRAGVYVIGREAFFIQGLVRHSNFWRSSSSFRYYKRVAKDATDFASPGDVTAAQLEILEGNEDTTESWVKAYGWDYYDHAGGESHYPPGEVMINCGGIEHHIGYEEITGTYTQGRGVHNTYTTPEFEDYGIFTKIGTGINTETNEVDPSSVDPIYAYCCRMWEKTGSHGAGAPKVGNKVCYGMVLDGINYTTEWFDVTATGWNKVDMSHYDVENATIYVRVGILT
jgi:hypothetical protein